MQRLWAMRYSQARSDHGPVVAAQRAVRAHEHVLERVLRVAVRAAQHLAGVGEQAGAVAVVDGAERVVGAVAEQRHELLVGAQTQQARRQRRASTPEA